MRWRWLRGLLKSVFIFYFGTSHRSIQCVCRDLNLALDRMCSVQNRNSKISRSGSRCQRSVPRIIYVQEKMRYATLAQPLFCSVNLLIAWWRFRFRCRRVLLKVSKRLARGTAEIQVMKSFFWKSLTWYFMFAVTRSILKHSLLNSWNLIFV